MRLKLLRLIVATTCFLFLSGTLLGQNFSFNCSRDTIVPGCPANLCITLKSIIPDIYGLTDSYSLNPGSNVPGCFPVYAPPNDPAGTPTNLVIDDTYSGVINIGFPFPFYGALYNSLVASTNGYISFDISLAGGFSHWQNRGDLPNTLYDRALIMGPYHDLLPGNASSPTQRIQYQVFGTAPHRRWILSFYRVPLFQCTNLIENTHQIILYESTGIIEVKIFDKQICFSWQGGKAMVGIQDFTRMKGMTAPGRKESDPAWGFIGMNETWRFVPNAGPSLFKRVELYDLGGTLLSTGTATSLGNGQLDVSFANVCAPAGAITPYIVKSVYQKIDDPSVEIFGNDTVRINRSAGLTATASSTAATCGSPNGTITVSAPTGGTPPYEYSLDGITWQGSNTFSGLVAGNYTVRVRDAGGICNTSIPVTVAQTGNLTATTSSTATSCAGVNNGTITVTSASGTGPYTFSLDGGASVPGVIPFTFTNIFAGNHTVLVNDLSNGCITNPIIVNVAAGSGVIAGLTQTPTSCPGASNGSITVTVTIGTGPFTFVLDGGAPVVGPSPHTFTNVASGVHTINITDAIGCILAPAINTFVPAGPPLAANATSSATSCSGASNGTITVTPTNGAAPYQYSLDGGAPQAGAVPYTFINVPAGNHNVVVTDGAGCVTNSIPVTVTAGPDLTTTVNETDVLCNGGLTGTITVTQPVIGTPPYQYSLDGVVWQGSNIFNGLAAGTYMVYYRESNGCQGSQSITIGEPTMLAATTATTAVICNGQNNGIITITAGGGVTPYQYSLNGVVWQGSNIFNVVAGNYTVTIKDGNNCITTRPVTVTEPAALTAITVNSNASCDGGNDGVITVTANGGNATYQYSIDGVTFQASNKFNVAPGNYTVTVKDNLGCTTTFNTVVGLTSNLSVTPQVDPVICEGTSTQLQLNSNATIYAWTPATGLSSSSIPNPVANPTSTTQYIVTATLGRCSANDTVVVKVNAAPIPNAGGDGFICYGQTYQLQASGGVNFSWTPSTYLSSASISNPIVTPDKTITYTLSVIDANGCHSLITDDVIVDVTPPIHVTTFPFDTIGYPGDQFLLLAKSAANIYTWSPAIGLSDPNIPNPVVTVGAIGNDVVYKVVASTGAGCKGEGFIRVKVYTGPDFYVATGFTPNNDGRNDKFIPFPVGIKKINYFKVFNRWGQMVYSTTTLNEGWDGKFQGKEQQTGVYVWMLQGVTKDDKIISKKGTVMLIR